VKAVRFHEHGAPDVLRYEDAPDPEPQPGWATVRVHACALNHLDLWQRRGIPRVHIPLPHISGSDIAGVVVDSGGSAITPGTRVLLYPAVSCGACPACTEGRQNLCAEFDVLGYLSNGGYAELVTVPAANLVPIPSHIDFVTAAAFPLTFLTAWHMLVTLARVKQGDTVLVLAGGSGVGQAAIPIARLHGARVLATSGPAKIEKTHALGAELVFDHYADDFSRHVRTATGGVGADIVVEHVGEATWERSVRSLARGGRLVTCGATTGHHASIDLRHLFARRLSLLGSYMGTRDELLAAAEHFFARRLTPVVDTVFPLADAAAAQQRLEAKEQFGKIVLDVGSPS
jgi:NADPH:quinone reductase-like Zn-dependent oxidoreductase